MDCQKVDLTATCAAANACRRRAKRCGDADPVAWKRLAAVWDEIQEGTASAVHNQSVAAIVSGPILSDLNARSPRLRVSISPSLLAGG